MRPAPTSEDALHHVILTRRFVMLSILVTTSALYVYAVAAQTISTPLHDECDHEFCAPV